MAKKKKSVKKKTTKQKEINPKTEIQKFEDRNNGDVEINLKGESIELTDGGIVNFETKRRQVSGKRESVKIATIPISDLTNTINVLRRARTLVKRLGYKTGKY